MKGQVQLPNDQLIDYYSFCKAIAEGISPTDLKGIDCVVGKQIPVSAASVTPSCQENRSPLSESLRSVELIGGANFKDQPTPNQTGGAESSTHSLPSLGQGEKTEEFSFPYLLSDEDRTLIEKLLPDLPALHFPFTEQSVTRFMNAYSAHPNRPAWKPLLVTAAHVEKLKAEQHKTMVLHQKVILEELVLGRLVAVTADHVRTTTFAPGVFIPRNDAIAYLKRCGILQDTKIDNGQTVENRSAKTGKGAAKQRLKKEDYAAIVEYRNKLCAQEVDDFVAQTAAKFGISVRYVSMIVAKAQADEDARLLRKSKAR